LLRATLPSIGVLRLCCLCCFALTLTAAVPGEGGIAIGDSVIRPIISEREKEALRAVNALEAELAQLRALPIEQRRAKERRLESDLEQVLDKATETKLENKALYLLAAWRVTYRDGEETLPLLDRIGSNPYPGYQNPAEALRVQIYLRQGRLREAREITDQLVASVPELGGLSALCSFYEMVGQEAPKTDGTPLANSPADPGKRAEPWLLYHFTGSLDAGQQDALTALLAETGNAAYEDVLRVVVVAECSNPLALLGTLRGIPGNERVDVLWANPAPDGDASAWRAAWKPPQLPATILLGPNRHVVAVQPSVADLGVLIGKTPAANNARPPATGRGPKAGWHR
jgi:hypothetical protein